MTTDLMLAFAGFAFVSSITPGPNNAMLLASGVNFGFRRTMPHIAGIAFGCVVMLVLVGFGLGEAFAAVPGLYDALRWAGAAYLLWLAWAIARSGPTAERPAGGRPFGFWPAAFFQWVNPKAWIMVVVPSAPTPRPTGSPATSRSWRCCWSLSTCPARRSGRHSARSSALAGRPAHPRLQRRKPCCSSCRWCPSSPADRVASGWAGRGGAC
jgi:hypothetical protein